MIGTTLSHFRITAKLGEGGMGEVYLAEDTKLGREVAIKVLPEAFTAERERLVRFKGEARALAALSHPNIAGIYEVGEIDGVHFLVMELASGETLADRIARGPIPPGEAIAIALRIAEALEAAHENGIIHRDLKPANIKVNAEGKVKVLDFGLAKVFETTRSAADPSASPTMTSGGTVAGVILGTAPYMSPQQARGETLDTRTDIWAFGAILYEMLAGRLAFSGNTVSDVLAAIIERDIDWAELPEATPWRIRELLRHCLHKDLRQRLHAIADARIEIEETLSGSEGPQFAAARPQLRRLAGWLAMTASLALVVGAYLGAVLWESTPVVDRLPVIQFSMDEVLDPGLGLDLLDVDRTSIAFSSDGRHIAFVAKSEDGIRRLHLRALDEVHVRELPETEGATTPFFSPDGQWIGFFQRWKMKKLPIAGGTPLTVSSGGSYGASWGPDDSIVFPLIDVSGLFTVSARGGTPEVLTVLDREAGEISHRWPQFLPGGKAILLTVGRSGNWDEAAIAVHSLETGERRIVIEGGTHARYSPTGHIVYARGGRLWAVLFDLTSLEVTGHSVPLLEGVAQSGPNGIAHFALSARGSFVYAPGTLRTPALRLVWVDREGNVEPLSAPPRRYFHPRLSPDGQSVAVGIDDVPPHVWLYDIAQQNLTRFTFESYNRMPIWTPDGAHVTWASPRGGPPNILWRVADGSGDLERLTRSQETVHVPLDWSPDGRVLLLWSLGATAEHDIWSLSVGEDRAQPFVATDALETNATFSPDGLWVAYQSDESGRYEIYVQPYPGPGGKKQLSTEGGESPLWSRDGSEIFFRSGERMMTAEASLEPQLQLGRPRELFRGVFSRGYAVFRGYDVSADGQRFLMAQHVDTTPEAEPLIVVLNWPGLLE